MSTKLEQTCEGCVDLGMHLEHLNGHEGVDCWYDCTYPLPWYVAHKAVRLDIKHICPVRWDVKED